MSFITNTQKNIGLAVIHVLQAQPRSNTIMIKTAIGKYTQASIYSCLKELQICEVVKCEIIREYEDDLPIKTDYFTLTDMAEIFKKQLGKPSIRSKKQRRFKKYAVFRCRRCGSVCYMRSDQQSSLCRRCGQRNKFDINLNIVLWTNDIREAITAVQVAKFKRKTFNVKEKVRPKGEIL